ncbi:MAG: hypothetical protein ABIP55_14450 [Tepidisphaeraceae bacterium]
MNDPRPTMQSSPPHPSTAHPSPHPSPGHPAHPQPVHPHPVPGHAGAPSHAVQPSPGMLRPAGSPGLGATPAPAMPGTMPRPMGAPPARPAITPAPQGLPRPGNAAAINPAAAPTRAADDEPVALVEDGDDDLAPASASTMSKIKQFSSDLGVKKHEWKRQTKAGGLGAVRVRTFHAKLSDQGLEYLDEAVNMFIDEHPEVDIKFVTTNIGMFDGKFKDLALIVNVWY